MESCTAWIVEFASELWIFLTTALNSKFSIALIGSLAGAFGGAVAAQRVIERSKRQELFIEEIRSTNAAIIVSFSICNIMMSMKKQLSLPLYEKFKSDHAALEEYNKKRKSGELKDGEIFDFVADFKTFNAPTMPIETLKDLVFNKISANARVLSATASLESAFVALKEMLLKRGTLVENIKTTIPHTEMIYYYFGLQLPTGQINQEYPDVLEAIQHYSNDVIFFSKLICDDFKTHGEKLRAKEKRFAKQAPNVSTANFNTPEAIRLLPPDKDYEVWLNGFPDIASKSDGNTE